VLRELEGYILEMRALFEYYREEKTP
jgi:hypothetical protein